MKISALNRFNGLQSSIAAVAGHRVRSCEIPPAARESVRRECAGGYLSESSRVAAEIPREDFAFARGILSGSERFFGLVRAVG